MRLVVVLVAVLLFTGCGTDERSASKRQSASVGDEACAPLAAGTEARAGPKPGETMLLTDLAVDSEVCADRVTFDFRPDLTETPGYRIGYRPAAEAQTEDASGRHIEVAGTAFLVVRFEPAATADVTGNALKLTYTGPRRLLAKGTRHVREVVKTGDFEAVLTWAIGLDERRPFKVTTSGSRPRLTVEIG